MLVLTALGDIAAMHHQSGDFRVVQPALANDFKMSPEPVLVPATNLQLDSVRRIFHRNLQALRARAAKSSKCTFARALVPINSAGA